MNRTKISVLLLLLLTVRLASAHKVPEAAWHRGTLASVETGTHTVTSGSYRGGTPRNYANPSWGSYPASGSISSGLVTTMQYTIETGNCLYTGTVRGRRSHAPDVTVHGPIEFAHDGKGYYLKDDQAKVYKFVLLTKALAPGAEGPCRLP